MLVSLGDMWSTLLSFTNYQHLLFLSPNSWEIAVHVSGSRCLFENLRLAHQEKDKPIPLAGSIKEWLKRAHKRHRKFTLDEWISLGNALAKELKP